MARQNTPLLAFNRGIISAKGLARVDLDRTRLSAERMVNWLPSTLGPMSIRPGTKYCGSSRNDTGAEWIEFVASTDDAELFLYASDQHYFADSSLPMYDADATRLLTQRVLEFLARVG